jgi:hypothetical protein
MTGAAIGLWRTLRAGSDARFERCEPQRSCEGSTARAGRPFGASLTLRARIIPLALALSFPGTVIAETPPLLVIGAGASLHGPLLFRDAKGRIILRLQSKASITTKGQ